MTHGAQEEATAVLQARGDGALDWSSRGGSGMGTSGGHGDGLVGGTGRNGGIEEKPS